MARGEKNGLPLIPGAWLSPDFCRQSSRQKVDTEGIGVLGYLPSLGSCLVKNPRSLMCLTTPPFQDVQKRIADSDSLEVPDQLPHPQTQMLSHPARTPAKPPPQEPEFTQISSLLKYNGSKFPFLSYLGK